MSGWTAALHRDEGKKNKKMEGGREDRESGRERDEGTMGSRRDRNKDTHKYRHRDATSKRLLQQMSYEVHSRGLHNRTVLASRLCARACVLLLSMRLSS